MKQWHARLIYAATIALVCAASACGGGADAQPSCAEATPARALALVNAARSEARYCGAAQFPAVPPLVLSHELVQAAQVMASDRAQAGTAGHVSRDGATHTERARRAGYTAPVGENTAAGTADLDATVAAFVASEGHCRNVMWPSYRDFGAACADGVAPYFAYWAHEFGAGKK